jgi:cytochrome c biogenesis protein CcmG/thiol:disulfide interchange protein DsbE
MRSRLAIAAMLLGVLLVGACRGSKPPQVGRPAPAFSLPSLADGSKVSLDQLRGKVVLLNFFGTWCPTCRAELPFIEGAWEQVNHDDVAFLIVDIGEESPDQVTLFMKQVGSTVPVVLNQTGEVIDLYGVTALPTTFIVDRQGVVRSVNVGAFSSTAAILARVNAVLK